VARLKARLRYQERSAQEGPFGASTPSSKIPIKASAQPENAQRQGGAKAGHCGHGRRCIPEEEISERQDVPAPEKCPYCGGKLDPRGSQPRTVIEVEPARKKVIRYQLQQCDCPHCQRVVTAPAPGVFPKALFGNRLLAHVALQHYVHGIPLGHLSRQLGLGEGSLWSALHQLAARLAPALEKLKEEYRRAPVKHADETGWRTDGRNGYAWLFRTAHVSLFRFRQSRSAQIPEEVLGTQRLRGTLVVDRYNGYNKAPCAIQYCYAHLLRDVQGLAKDFPDEPEVSRFVAQLAPLLSQAMQLRAQKLTRVEFVQRALELKMDIKTLVHTSAKHPGVQKIQNIFRENSARLYHWANNPAIPAENNATERELRRLVIARKISFGSQSENGARTRETLMSVLHTLAKRTDDLFGTFHRALNALAQNDKLDPYKLLFDSG
jgi:transposase